MNLQFFKTRNSLQQIICSHLKGGFDDEKCTHVEEPCGYAVPCAQLFKGIRLIFLFQNKSQNQVLLPNIKSVEL